MVELGYLLTPDDIKTNDTETLKQYVLQKSSIQSLAHRYPKIEPRQLLSLLGDKISDRHEVPTMPSSEAEVDDVFYFFGAYTTETYHFHDEKNNKGLDAVQIEIPQKFRLTSEGYIKNFNQSEIPKLEDKFTLSDVFTKLKLYLKTIQDPWKVSLMKICRGPQINQADNKVWLVKVPKFLSHAWKNIDQENVNLGNLRIYKEQ
ncbi:unnamed protein product [Rhizopus stolonifer]